MGMKKGWLNKVSMTGIAVVLSVGLVACSGTSKNTSAPKQDDKKVSEAVVIDKNNKDALKVTLAGGSVGGFWSGLGQSVSKAFSNSYPGSAATYEPGSGAGNIKLLDEGQVEVGLVQSVEVTSAKKGLQPFPKKYDNMMALATLYDNAVMQISARKDFTEKYGVNNFEDIVKKKVPAKIAINQKGNMNSAAAYTVLESYGITEKTLKDWGGSLTWSGSAARFEAMQNSRADISVDFVFAPDAKVTETSVNTPLVLWSINDNAIKKMKEEWNLNKTIIPKGTYEWMKEDVVTITETSLILVGTKTTPQDQYKMAKALKENLDTLKAVHPAMNSMTLEKLANTGSIPLAPGAQQYYKEIGAIK